MSDSHDSTDFKEPQPDQGAGQRRSSISKIVDALKKPFQHREKKENPPALQEAIDKMEARKAKTAQDMEEEGKDTSVLSSKRTDIANPLK